MRPRCHLFLQTRLLTKYCTRMKNTCVAIAWRAWKGYLEAMFQGSRRMQRAITAMLHRQLSRGFNQWRAWVNYLKAKLDGSRRMQRAVKAMLHRRWSRGLNQWRMHVMQQQMQEAARASEQTRAVCRSYNSC